MNWASVPSPFIERSPCASRQVPVLALPEFRGRDMAHREGVLLILPSFRAGCWALALPVSMCE